MRQTKTFKERKQKSTCGTFENGISVYDLTNKQDLSRAHLVRLDFRI